MERRSKLCEHILQIGKKKDKNKTQLSNWQHWMRQFTEEKVP